MKTLIQRQATDSDLAYIIKLLEDDTLGKNREESRNTDIHPNYRKAFAAIEQDPNQYLMVVEKEWVIVGTCHLTLMPSLTYTGTLRLQIEAVRIHHQYRQSGIGKWMIAQAINYGNERGAGIVQLSSNKLRKDAIAFYKKLGFESSHEGMKYHLNK